MRLLDLLLAALVLAGLAGVAELALREAPMAGPASAVDGDTLDLMGEHVRLQGIDAPELAQTCTRDDGVRNDGVGNERVWACGQAARRALADLLRKGPVTCAVQGRDVYDRPLARCAVDGEDLCARLVSQGLAIAYLSRDYRGAEAEARAARRGVWAGPFERPADYRAAHPR